MENDIQLVIKAANQRFGDQKIQYHGDWTVLDLKKEISLNHPGKPLVRDQRLIYSGQLLQDSLCLKEVLRHPPENNAHTIHLVSTVRQGSANQKPDHSQPSSSSISPSHQPMPPDLSTDGVRRRVITTESTVLGAQGLNSTGLYPHLSQVPPPLQGISDPFQQIATMQQMYAQYMASYMQHMQTQQISQDTSYVTATAEANDQNRQIQPNVNDAQQPRNVANRLAPPVGAGEGLLAGGEDEEDAAPRDWLDYLHRACRLGFLLAVIYFHTTFGRFMLAMVVFVGYYLYQAGWIFAADGRRQQPAAQQANPEDNRDPGLAINAEAAARQDPPPEVDHHREPDPPTDNVAPSSASDSSPAEGSPDGAADEATTNENVSPTQDTPTEVTEEESTVQRPSLLSLTWIFLTSFFTSLVPENQHQIVA